MVTKEERNRLLFHARGIINRVGGPDLAQTRRNALADEFQAATGVSKERAPHYVAKAIRQARAPRRAKPKKGG